MKERPTRWNDDWNDLPADMRRFATCFGPTDEHILLLGPPGSGKGYLARILHALSSRAGGPFVPRNCGVFTESLAESQLYGYAKGAFTGATHSKPGMVEAAAGGTLFLDEFGALPHWIQAMFHTLLETREFSRLGSTTVRKADVRVIAATACDGGGELHLDGADLSPVTEVEGEVTSATHLEQLKGLYRDRERLLAENGEAHAAGQGKSLEEAKKKVDELIAFHVRGVFFQIANEKGIVPTRARLADIIAGYGSVAAEEVMADMDRVDVPFPGEVATER